MKRLMLLLVAVALSAGLVYADGLSNGDANKINQSSPAAKQVRLGSLLDALQTRPIPVLLAGTLGVDKGPGTDGVLVGSVTAQAVTKYFSDDGGEFTDDTTDINDADANDTTVWPAAPEVDDANYWGMSVPWCEAIVTVGTAASASMTTVAEYFNGTAWATLTLTLDETAKMQPAATGAKKFAFVPPSNWTKTTVNSVSAYWVRFRVSAYTSITTAPLITSATIIDFRHFTGLPWPSSGTVTGLSWYAATKSGSTANSIFALVNATRGTWATFAATKATALGTVTGLSLKIAQGDQVAVMQLGEDGTTEFANMALWVKSRW